MSSRAPRAGSAAARRQQDQLVQQSVAELFDSTTKLATDFEFVVVEDDRRRIGVHKWVVCAGSEELHRFVYGWSRCGGDGGGSSDSDSGNGSGGGSNSMEVYGIMTEEFLQILSYLYKDEIQLTLDNAIDIMHTADYLGLTVLRNRCSDLLSDHLTYANCLPVFAHLQTLSAYPELRARTLRLIRYAPMRTAFEHPSWPDQTPAVVREILGSAAINCNEWSLFEALWSWTRQRCERRLPAGGRLAVSEAAWTREVRAEIDDLDDCIRWSTMRKTLFDRCMQLAPNLYEERLRQVMRMDCRGDLAENQREFLTCPNPVWCSEMPQVSTRHLFVPIKEDVDWQRKTTYVACTQNGARAVTRTERLEMALLVGTGYEWVPFDPSAVDVRIPHGALIIGDADRGAIDESEAELVDGVDRRICPPSLLGRVARSALTEPAETSDGTKPEQKDSGYGELLLIDWTHMRATYASTGKPVGDGVRIELLVGRNVEPPKYMRTHSNAPQKAKNRHECDLKQLTPKCYISITGGSRLAALKICLEVDGQPTQSYWHCWTLGKDEWAQHARS